MYRLTITYPAINIPVPLIFWHEFRTSISKFPGWRATVFGRRCLCFDGAVPIISCMLTLLTANRHSFSFIYHNY